ncbi:MAG TPA: LPS export ABC transporter periplasmic protein LptC, partial [Stenotrophomonas sp.]|nr:LPS export ABC transporter periplasmic protein LptC [Stenotrophomonas sp.]
MNTARVNWRTVLGVGLLLAALLSSWAALRNRDKGPVSEGQDAGVDYILHDFQIVA